MIEELLKRGVLKFGEFRLKSGRLSPYFFNVAALNDGAGLRLVADAFTELIFKERLHEQFDVILGAAYKGIPLAAAIVLSLAERGVNKRFAYDRKEVKSYGDAADHLFVGNIRNGDRILLVDDVITSGETKLKLVEQLKNVADVKVAALLIFFDREETTDRSGISAVEVLERHGIRVYSVLQASKVFKELRAAGKLEDENFARIKEYFEKYGCARL
ncbi:MAG: Orotate phosphoribosyltransferase [Candidatus Alkanophagales archaeon MCA70_species_2]|nr:Orotate phosphoribosyltransferase [Candidatus Alkanophaga liquidiphilum]